MQRTRTTDMKKPNFAVQDILAADEPKADPSGDPWASEFMKSLFNCLSNLEVFTASGPGLMNMAGAERRKYCDVYGAVLLVDGVEAADLPIMSRMFLASPEAEYFPKKPGSFLKYFRSARDERRCLSGSAYRHALPTGEVTNPPTKETRREMLDRFGIEKEIK